MRSDTDYDTRSPWYDAFAPQAAVPVNPVPFVTAPPAEIEQAARPETADPDGSSEALFDCYNA